MKIKSVFSGFVLCTAVLGILCSCSNGAENWQKVKLGEHQSIKVPSEWTVTTVNDILYFSDKPLDESNVTVYMFQSHSDAGSENELEKYGDGARGIVESNELCDSFQARCNISSAVISNGASYGTQLVSVDDEEQNILYLDVAEYDSDYPNVFYVWKNNVDESTLLKIAETYDGYHVAES